MRTRGCSTHWVEVGSALGGVWFRGKYQRFVAVRPDGSVLGANYVSRDGALLALAKDFHRRERSTFRGNLIALFGGGALPVRPAVGMEN